MGCWTPVEHFGGENSRWQARPLQDDYSEFEILLDNQPGGIMRWDLIGQHNANNALAVAAAAGHVGITAGEVCEAMASFKSVKRRLQLLGVVNDITLYDDFAHHPTAIRVTLNALRSKVGKHKIIAIMEPRSNTMRMGVHGDALAKSFSEADHVIFYQPENINWDLKQQTTSLGSKREIFSDIDNIVENVDKTAKPGDHIVFMSNGGFGGIQQKLLKKLQEQS
jgi:UDP-N-acetylmuramate: L-alanyl-gamma-D-glutamyl-meso-diaminopimelate ligase